MVTIGPFDPAYIIIYDYIRRFQINENDNPSEKSFYQLAKEAGVDLGDDKEMVIISKFILTEDLLSFIILQHNSIISK